MIKVEIVKGRAHWHWRAKDAGNGEILCSSETYSSFQKAQNGAATFLDEFGVHAMFDRMNDKLYVYKMPIRVATP